MIIADFDGCIVNFARAAYAEHGRLGEYIEGQTPTKWTFYEDWGLDLDEFWAPIHRAGAQFWANLELTSAGFCMIQVLKSKQFGEFLIATHPSKHPSSFSGKASSLFKHFGEDFSHYSLTGCKEIIGRPGWVLIDDYEKNCDRFIEQGGDAILFPAAWNKNRKLAGQAFSYVINELHNWNQRQPNPIPTPSIESQHCDAKSYEPVMVDILKDGRMSVFGPVRMSGVGNVVKNIDIKGRRDSHDDEPARTIADCKKELDPHGKDPHEKGAKLDAGKNRVHLCFRGFADALEAVASITSYGAKKYTDDGWHEVPNAISRYLDAANRHYLAYCKGEQYDPESNLLHLAHEAWNVLAVLQLEIERMRDEPKQMGAVSGLREAMRIKEGECNGSTCGDYRDLLRKPFASETR